MVVARPVEPTSVDFQNFGSSAPIVPTKLLTDPAELDRMLLQNGFCNFQPQPALNYESEEISQIDYESIDVSLINGPNYTEYDIDEEKSDFEVSLPETERFTVELHKNECGLGITIAGYVCEREDLSGIFVKSLNESSEAFKCGKIRVNDRIVEVDGESLRGFTNYQAVDKLKRSGEVVTLTLERYLRGPKFEHLQEALACQEVKNISPPSPSVKTLSWIPIDTEVNYLHKNSIMSSNKIILTCDFLQVQIELENDSVTTVNSEIYEINPETKEIFIEENFEANPEDDLETATKHKWENIVGSDTEIVVANLTKLKGLGISLEGTVDVEGGLELRPHHYIRSILPEGPVGQNGKLKSGDELLEVNGQKLMGIRHVEVVRILRDLPNAVRLVCARKNDENRVINTSQDRAGFEARNILGGSLKNLLTQPEQRLLKALSDTSINTSSTTPVTEELNLQKTKSRSLEATNLAVWSDKVEFINLKKSDRGLGFSILDYQDPLDSNKTVIVIRSLVPNGSAEVDGRITPGDRLISVNGKDIKNVTLDQAVQALKGVPMGVVRLGISKPMPCSRVSGQTNGT